MITCALVAMQDRGGNISMPVPPEGIVVTVTKNGKQVKGVPTWQA